MAVQATLQQRRISVVGISSDSAADSEIFAGRNKIDFPLCEDPGLVVSNTYGVAQQGVGMAIPAMFVVDQDNTIVWRHIGEKMSDHPPQQRVLQATDMFA